ncbi:Zn-dependent hydrolase, glyoxylase [Synechococcus sp. PCC 7502]|uniref:MBL fold metallo-hydrolase n=1 Tax=Synechococcus sp. PCC 7502 TaxID=1173263 RepID=UPI00029FB01F|nr:MBL fold metallo-hydrolase [Synechococcus sp. PCC 7502]AFY73255.1 Zn-dependent hydrolase, glyoxylase [Synechococcus sp. PCC 7502]
MAQISQRRSQNVSGDFYVDHSCIDCDTCRWMAPEIFIEVDERSAVYHQPANEAERLKALQALLACPTASIGTVAKPKDIGQVQQSFPILIAENVYHCGYHSQSSYGAASYLIQLPEGNILIDSPRFSPPLVQKLEQMGGVRYLYLTHRDDVADHAKFHQHFGAVRILHQDDISLDTKDVEMPISGNDARALGDELLIIPVPGHTKGHTVLLYKNRFLFSGDHLAWSEQLGHLFAFRNACWYSWTELINSMHRLSSYKFEWVLPGHGRRYHSDPETMAYSMQQCLKWL